MNTNFEALGRAAFELLASSQRVGMIAATADTARQTNLQSSEAKNALLVAALMAATVEEQSSADEMKKAISETNLAGGLKMSEQISFQD